jgi:hypothetical protein
MIHRHQRDGAWTQQAEWTVRMPTFGRHIRQMVLTSWSRVILSGVVAGVLADGECTTMKNSLLRCAAIAIATYSVTAMAAEYRVPRLADGTPDLQCVWTNSSATPLERAPALGKRRAYTDEEAARVERTARARVDNDAKPTDPDLKISAAASLPPVGNYNQFWTDRGMNVAVINGEKRTSVIIDPPEGRIPPLLSQVSQARSGNTDSRPTRNRPSGDLGEAFTGPEGFPVAAATEEPSRDESDPALNGRADGPEQRGLGERCILASRSRIPQLSRPNSPVSSRSPE